MLRNISVCLCLLFSSAPVWRGYAQEPPKPQPSLPAQASETPPPAAVQPVQQPAAAPAGASRPYLGGDGEFSLGIFYWASPGVGGIRKGKASTIETPTHFDFPKQNSQNAPGLNMNIPLGRDHTLRMSYFRSQFSGNKTIDNDINLFGVDYLRGQTVSSSYTMQNGRMSLDYTSWPFPIRNSRFRVKTFWEVQYTTIRAVADAPLEPVYDEDGNFISRTGGKTHWFLYPSVGMGVEYFLSRTLRFEMKGSGFYIPGRSNIWDADALLAYRRPTWEIGLGARAFHFKTSPKSEEFYRITLPGAYLGLRWYPK